MAKGESGFQKSGSGGSIVGPEPSGRKMSLARFLENLQKNSASGMLDSLQDLSPKAGKASFFTNGNAVKFQEAVIESGTDKASIRFINGWNPMQVSSPTSAIKQTIEVVYYKNGNASAIRKLDEKSSKSLKNAEKNYHDMLEKWKKLTGQKSISFR
jgi:hypothetical protein|nr:MAG TPA: hypothetical protein [Caudoviricetes sp.]